MFVLLEFVHGDFGRTQPSIGMLMGDSVQAEDVDIHTLDVINVELVWP